MVNEDKHLIWGKGPVTAADVKRMGIERENMLDLSPIGIGLRSVARCVGFEQGAPFCLCHAPAASDGFSY